jgi:hypothetical protein
MNVVAVGVSERIAEVVAELEPGSEGNGLGGLR